MFITTAEVALAAPVIAIGGTLVGFCLQSREDAKRRRDEREREKERWQREDAQRDADHRHAQNLRGLELRHQDYARWVDRRFSAHSRFLDATRLFHRRLDELSTSIAGVLDALGLDMPPAPESENMPDFNVSHFFENLTGLISELQLVASDSVIDRVADIETVSRAARVSIFMLHASWMNENRRKDGRKHLKEDAKRLKVAIERYRAAARSELGTVVGRVEGSIDTVAPDE